MHLPRTALPLRASSVRSAFGRTTARTVITLSTNPILEYEDSGALDEGSSEDKQLLYGANAVRAALVARKRSFQQLYTFGNDPSKRVIVDMARKARIDIVETVNRGVLNNFSGNRPHNGVVLECSNIPETMLSALGDQSQGWKPIVENENPMAQDQIVLDIPKIASNFPTYLLLDELTDPQNVGSIIRTAYFMGVTGIILSAKNCSTLSPLVAKASSGALEFLNIYHTRSTMAFLRTSRKNGWACVATVGMNEKLSHGKRIDLAGLPKLHKSSPVIYVFGSESSGLRTTVKKECNLSTSVPAAGSVNPVVDSLNVGVSVACILSYADINSHATKSS